MKFKGDIIITDPCYIIKEDDSIENLSIDDWSLSECGLNMEILGIENYITNDMCEMYEEGWSCTVIDDAGNVLGEFASDSGQVSVFLLEEVLRYNPNYIDHIENQNLVTLIKDFDGDIIIKNVSIAESCKTKFNSNTLKGIMETLFVEFNDPEMSNEEMINILNEKGVRVIGTGNINFVSFQSGVV